MTEKLWSHQVAQSLIRDPTSEGIDARYALNGRYGEGMVLILPLPSGLFGVFGNNRQLVARVSGKDLTSEFIRQISEVKLEEAQQRAKAKAKVEETAQVILESKVSLEDLGI